MWPDPWNLWNSSPPLWTSFAVLPLQNCYNWGHHTIRLVKDSGACHILSQSFSIYEHHLETFLAIWDPFGSVCLNMFEKTINKTQPEGLASLSPNKITMTWGLGAMYATTRKPGNVYRYMLQHVSKDRSAEKRLGRPRNRSRWGNECWQCTRHIKNTYILF